MLMLVEIVRARLFAFWRKIGMTPSRYATKSSHSRRTVDSYGYELSITLRNLLQKIILKTIYIVK